MRKCTHVCVSIIHGHLLGGWSSLVKLLMTPDMLASRTRSTLVWNRARRSPFLWTSEYLTAPRASDYALVEECDINNQ